jgi:secreted trypsin-like serine protease
MKNNRKHSNRVLVSIFVIGGSLLPSIATAKPFIIGGEPARPDDFPWEVALLRTADKSLLCGGSHLGGGWIVTAAHCMSDGSGVKKNDINVFYGSNDLTSGGQTAALSLDPIVHENWDPSTLQNDIALVKIDEPANLPYVRIAADAVEPSITSPGAYLTISGWGRTAPNGPISTRLLKAGIPAIDHDACKDSFLKQTISDTQLCAGTQGKGACYGDSGGPLSGLDADGIVLVGIASFGGAPCAVDLPDVFTRVVKFRDWITKNSQKP